MRTFSSLRGRSSAIGGSSSSCGESGAWCSRGEARAEAGSGRAAEREKGQAAPSSSSPPRAASYPVAAEGRKHRAKGEAQQTRPNHRDLPPASAQTLMSSMNHCNLPKTRGQHRDHTRDGLDAAQRLDSSGCIPSLTSMPHTFATRQMPRLFIFLTLVCKVLGDVPWQNASLPFSVRVANLISLLSVDEKASLLSASSAAVPRLNLTSFSYARECERGDSSGPLGTAFPSGAALAATWDVDLVEAVALSTAVEARANANAHGGSTICYGPVVNFVHDATWGRTNEMLGGEDVFLGGVLGAAFVRGLQSLSAPTPAGERYRAALSIVKHLNVYSGPEGHGYTFGPFATRFSFDVVLPSTRADREFFLPMFRATAEAGASGFMCSYSSVTGAFNQTNTPACASHALLTGVLRDEWAFDGLVVSDAGAVVFIGNTSIGGVPFGHHYTQGDETSAIAALEAGMDIELTCCGAPAVFPLLPGAVAAGRLAEATLDTALARSLTRRFELGGLDDGVPFASLGAANVSTPAMIALAREVAGSAVVLMTNVGMGGGAQPLLPLSPDALAGRTVAVIGPCANDTWAVMGGYVNTHPRFVRTPYEGLVDALPLSSVILDPACADTSCPTFYPSAIALAASSDIVVAFVGTTSYYHKGSNNESTACGCPLGNAIEGECCDRTDTALPGSQLELLQALAATGKPLIVVMISGGSLDAAWARDSPAVSALLHAPFLGMAAGAGIADVLVGARNPSARLTLTWYQNLTATLPPLGDYSALYRSTYRYADAATTAITYPFGHGLSYSSFSYAPPTFNASAVHVCDTVAITVSVKNTGAVAGFEVIQVYGSIKGASVAPVPIRQLMGWRKVWIPAGETAQVTLPIPPTAHVVFVGDVALETVEPGSIDVWVGGGSDPSFPGVAGAAGRFDVVGVATPVSHC